MNEEQALPSSRTYQVTNGRIIGFVDDLQAMRQAVDKILQTLRNGYMTYSDQYGHELDSLIGKDMDYAEHDLPRLIEEALLVDDRILSVDVLNITVTDSESLHADVMVKTIYGTFTTESEVKF